MAAADNSLKTLIDKCLPDDPKGSDSSFEKIQEFAQLAEASDRFDNMMTIMKSLVVEKLDKKLPLSPEERNLLSVAYKNVVGGLRQAWRVISGDDAAQNGYNSVDAELKKKYQEMIQGELKTVCEDVLGLLAQLTTQLNARMTEKFGSMSDDEKAKDATYKSEQECQVFYLKMQGDYYRYLTEVYSDDKSYKEGCQTNYKSAMDVAEKALAETHPTRLGLALNFSVCYYEILGEQKKACRLAKKAFDQAIEKLDSLNDSSYKDSTLIMQLLRDNLTIWNSNENEDDADAPAVDRAAGDDED